MRVRIINKNQKWPIRAIDQNALRAKNSRAEKQVKAVTLRVNMAERAAKYEGYKKKQALKRKNKDDKNKKVADFITVQRLTPNVEGKCQKYGRIGPLSIVPFPYDSFTLDNIKKACTEHFQVGPHMSCDVLAGERGPSYTSMDQAKNTNVIHIRFFFDAGEGFHQDDDEKFFMRTTPGFGQHSSQNARSYQESEAQLEDNRGKRRIAFSDGSLRKKTKQSDGAFPKSVPLSRLLKMGKLLHPSNDEVLELSIEEFSVEEGKWLVPFPAKISLGQKPFQSGGFRDAFEARVVADCSLGQRGSKFVLKKFKESEVEEIKLLFPSLDDLTRKTVQMHCIAKYYATKLQKEVRSLENYGDSFTYCNCYLATHQGKLFALEEFIEGKFVKFINNNGCIVSTSMLTNKAEAFSHYTYVKSKKSMMVLDIQGCGFRLCDPEIATATSQADLYNDGLFCCGNLHTQAIKKFLSEHKCNRFCHQLGLPGNHYSSSVTVEDE